MGKDAMMKTKMRRSSSVRLMLGLLALALLLLALPLTARADEVIGKITRLTGTATLIRQAVTSPIKAAVGMPVQLGDHIKTDAASMLRIELKDGSILTMGEKADLNLDRFEFDPNQETRSASFKVDLGKVRVFAKDLLKFKKKDFEIRTPTAVVGVRGTLFLVWVEEGVTHVACFENKIQVSSYLEGRPFIDLTENFSTDVLKDQDPTTPVLMTEEQYKQFQEGLGVTEVTTTEATTTEATTTEATTTEATTTTPTIAKTTSNSIRVKAPLLNNLLFFNI